VVGTIPGVVSFVKLITGGSIARPLGAQVQAAMFVVCLVLLVLCIRSFRQARIRRVAEARGL
jgi:membrane protein implicated in regulation of membrane protease activity